MRGISVIWAGLPSNGRSASRFSPISPLLKSKMEVFCAFSVFFFEFSLNFEFYCFFSGFPAFFKLFSF
jgi:hypothetical protein